jgi:glucosamine-phosphate N-acetyltransferase
MDLSTHCCFPVQATLSRPTAESDELTIRELTVADLDNGFLEALSSLSDVGLTPEEAIPFFQERLAAGVRTYVACAGVEVVGTASLLLERKFLHRGGLVAHIEDVAVRRDLQRHGVGTQLIRHVTEEACRLGCYKVILNCFDDRVGFYTRLGYRLHDCGMRRDC